MQKDSLKYEDILNNVSLASKTPKCDTKNRILVHSGESIHVVVCPQPPAPERHHMVEVFSEGWVLSGSDTVQEPVLNFLEDEQRDKMLKSRSVVVEYLGKESGYYSVTWLELTRRFVLFVARSSFERCVNFIVGLETNLTLQSESRF